MLITLFNPNGSDLDNQQIYWGLVMVVLAMAYHNPQYLDLLG
jgi:hypothetical protein